MGTYQEYLMENSTYVRTNLIFNLYAAFFPNIGVRGHNGKFGSKMNSVSFHCVNGPGTQFLHL